MGIASPRHGRRTAAGWLAIGVLMVANIGLLLSVAGTFPSLSNLLAPLTGHFIGVGLAASLALIARRRTVTMLAAGLVVTLGVHAVLALAWCCHGPRDRLPPLTAFDTPGAGRDLTVLSLNTWHGNGSLDRLLRYLASAPADVIVLSELGAGKRALLEQLKQAYPFQVDCTDEKGCALAVLSRLPFEAAGSSRIAAGKSAFVWARIAGANYSALTIIGTALNAPGLESRAHERQMAELAQFVRRIDGPLVLAGDLNTSPWSQTFRSLRLATGLQPASLLLPSWPAWPIALPQFALDHIFVSQDLLVASAGTGPAVGSDHLPVWAHIARRPLSVYRGRQRGGSRLAAAAPHLGGKLLADLGGEHGGAGDLGR